MKILLSIAGLFLLGSSVENCSSKKAEPNEYKGRLEIAGICKNYTLSMVEGKADTALFNSSWTDETTGKSYTNAFGLANPCDFPSEIKPGDEFSFTIDSAQTKDCMVCMAYYPTPSKKISIKVRSN
jgi:hypothetical protein